MDAQAGGIIGFFVFAFIVMMAGIAAEQNGIYPSGLNLLSGVLALVGIFLIIKKSGALGSFKIRF